MIENSKLIKQAQKNLKIETLNEMQETSLETCANNENIILLSPTGSGKTLGFLLPVLSRLEKNKPDVQALILVPSRELALQIEQVFKKMATGFKVNVCYGGHSITIEKNNLSEAPAVLVGTPGRIADHIRRGHFDHRFIQTLVLDEFDKSLELGFQKEMSFIIKQLKRLKKRILTSATHMDDIPPFTGISKPAEINFLEEELEGLSLRAVVADGHDKLDTLYKLICKLGNESTLVFCNHRDAVERISGLLKDKGLSHDTFHGGMEQDDRERALLKFRNGSHHMLITTDLASRGLDIPEIKYVVHYQSPSVEPPFIHRNGRTARMNAEGKAYLVLGANEKLPSYLEEYPETEELSDNYELPQKPEWATLYFGLGKKDKINKIDIVGLLLQKGELEKDDLGLIEVKDRMAFAAVKRAKVSKTLKLIQKETIKRKKVKVAISK